MMLIQKSRDPGLGETGFILISEEPGLLSPFAWAGPGWVWPKPSPTQTNHADLSHQLGLGWMRTTSYPLKLGKDLNTHVHGHAYHASVTASRNN